MPSPQKKDDPDHPSAEDVFQPLDERPTKKAKKEEGTFC